jgi:hypothetical protein
VTSLCPANSPRSTPPASSRVSPRSLAKQVPYAIGQFTVNERCTEFIYNQMTAEQKANLSPTASFTITLSSGIVAGFAAAVLSHVSGVPAYPQREPAPVNVEAAGHEQLV